MTTREAAKALGVSSIRIRQLIDSGRLRAVRHGRDWWIELRSLEAVRVRKPGRPRGRASR
jgi:excisionase family DNA binding protein